MRKGRHRHGRRSAHHRGTRRALLLRIDKRLAGLTLAGALVVGGLTAAGMIETSPVDAAGAAAAVDPAALRDRLREEDRSSRSGRTPPSPSPTPAPTATATATAAPTKPKPTAPATPAHVKPIGDLDQRQMDHATTIVRVAERRGMPERAMVVALATVLQESYLRNLANPSVPESERYSHEGEGADHDSVGLFQQRPSSGWGTVANLMNPTYATNAFFDALEEISGWEQMSIAAAAQSVQISAFPDAYAQHESFARRLVTAIRHPG
ncbi:hypothetical protein [Rhizomonospora bruguierae]|uniref:hypothetical protein n=1 Tax=Rhizomonospora bruguierae TaxID=1581705 RepID=UPI001BCBBE93|nr:hypothetical protein [Micromonospora sp. NBRC 107566]